jgi:hypothetical protein
MQDIDTLGAAAIATAFTLVGTAIVLIAGAAAVQHFWNGAVPAVFSLKSLTYGEAFSLMALVYIMARFSQS